MKNKELIDILSECDPCADVVICVNDKCEPLVMTDKIRSIKLTEDKSCIVLYPQGRHKMPDDE